MDNAIKPAKTFLEILNKRLPGQHRVELDTDGNLMVSLSLPDRQSSFTLGEPDLSIPVNVLADDLCNMVKDEQN